MKQLYTATLIAATLLTTGVDAQNQKVTSPLRATIIQTAVKERTPQGRTALMAAKGIERLQHQAGDDASRGGVINDDCATAQSITLIAPDDCATAAIVGNNSAASNGAEQPGCDDPSDAGYQDVWYTFNSDAYTSSNITLTPDDPSTQDWGLVVYDACGGNEVYCEITPSGPVTVALNPGTDYYVRVYSNLDWGVGGPFTLCASYVIATDAPANDECTGAVNQDLAVGSSVTFTGDNTGATDNGEGLDTPAVWEMFTTTECSNLALTYCGTTPPFGNAFANLFVGCPLDTFVVNSSFDATSCADGNFTIFYTEVPAGVYYYAVMLDPDNSAVGPYTITVSATACALPPANDECAGAIELTPGVDCIPLTGTTDGATQSMDPILCNGYTSPDANDVWYSFTATETDNTVTIEGLANFDAVMELFSGDCGTLTSILCGDPTFPNPDPVTEVTLLSGLTVGQTYYLRVYDYAHGSTGHNFNICITTGLPPAQYCIPAPPNGPTDGDYITNVTLGSINNTTGGDNAYEDYTSQNTLLEQGDIYDLSITSGLEIGDVFAAWIDYNSDSTFQVSEKLGEFEGTAAAELMTLSFTVPVDAPLGTTRLRVRCVYGATDMEPCDDYFYGETEDYHVEITIPTGVREYNSANVSVYPNPSNGNITINGADLNGSVNFELTDMTGRVVYQDQRTTTAGQPVTLALNGKLAQGTYSLRMITANGISSRPVMIK